MWFVQQHCVSTSFDSLTDIMLNELLATPICGVVMETVTKLNEADTEDITVTGSQEGSDVKPGFLTSAHVAAAASSAGGLDQVTLPAVRDGLSEEPQILIDLHAVLDLQDVILFVLEESQCVPEDHLQHQSTGKSSLQPTD